MRVIRFGVCMGAVCTGLILNLEFVSAQRPVGQSPANPVGPRYPSAIASEANVVSQTLLRMDSASDEALAEVAVQTLANGRKVLSVTVQPSRRTVAPGNDPDLVFVAADIATGTYRSFRVKGPVADDPRVKAHLKSRLGVDWEANRAKASATRRRPAAYTPTTPEPSVRYPRTAAQLSGDRRPKVSPAVYRGSAAQEGTSCVIALDIEVQTQDPFGLVVASSRSQAFSIEDWYAGGGHSTYSWADNWTDPYVWHYVTFYGYPLTTWYRDLGSATDYRYFAQSLLAIAEQNQYYWNTDFPLSLGNTSWVWHYIYLSADVGDWFNPVVYKTADDWGPVPALLSSGYIDRSWQGCQPS